MMAMRRAALLLLLASVTDAALVKHAARHQHKLRPAPTLAAAQGVARLGQGPVVTSESTSWFKRMQDSMAGFVLGIVMIIFSIPILWVNESRSAQVESLISYGKTEVRSVGKGAPGEENNNRLVHVAGLEAKAAAPVADEQFDAELLDDCIRLRSEVEVYQVIENVKKEQREKLGGGKETVSTYTYSEAWSSSWNDSGNYQDISKRVNRKPGGLQVTSSSAECQRVELGEGFLLSDELVVQCDQWASAHQRLPQILRLKGNPAAEFKLQGDGFFFLCPAGGKQQSLGGGPQIGDARVKFRYVPNHEVTVLALQSSAQDSARASFLPYRSIKRGWFGTDEEVEKERLHKEGRKTPGDLASEASFGGVFACLCCACNLVNMCFKGLLAPEINHLFAGDVGSDKCFANIAKVSGAVKWIFRLVGWLMMFWGLYALFSPFLTLIKVIPFLGPLVASLGGALIWFLCLVTTLVVASAIVCVAYLFYHPLLALAYMSISAAAVAGVYFLAAHA